jgi:hypothetical protein
MSNPHAEFLDLASHHYAMLTQESAILPELIAARGYRTISKKKDLEAFQFATAQRRVPALLIPIYNAYGEIVLYQLRPDVPRLRKGKSVKYETPAEALMALDVPPTEANRQGIRNPEKILWITEGIKKGDALVSAGAIAIALLGVWNWRGANVLGGKTVVAGFEDIALSNHRPVHIAYDSDVMEKPAVFGALTRLGGWLESRGARVSYVYLPSTENGGKQGVDDYLARGHRIEDLMQFATTQLRSLLPPDITFHCPYEITPTGIIMRRLTRDGEITVPLANFSATIYADVLEDNGAERQRRMEMEARLGDRTTRFTISASAFSTMSWIVEHLGAEAIIMPGMMIKDHCRTAIQMLSKPIVHRTVYTHLGWRQLDDAWCYLHSDGAIGPFGTLPHVDVALGDSLQHYALPELPWHTEDMREAVRSSLRVLEVATDEISIPIYMSVWRSVLDAARFSLYIVGPTGAGKSTLAALAHQHFGAEMNASHLPGSWTSTANALGELQFLAKDALLTIDDFCPTGSYTDQQRLQRHADLVFRNQGNGTGRQRMRPEGGLQGAKPPRGLILATGEDLPHGQSMNARMLVIDMHTGSLNWELLSACQLDAANGLYSLALSGFIHWLAPQYDAIKEAMPGEVIQLRSQTQQGGHRRTADIAAHLLFGWELFLTYAYKIGAITEEERQSYVQRGWRALATVAQAQAELQHSEDPVGRFFALLRAVLSSGQAHLADRESNHIPMVNADHYGWRNIATRTPGNTAPSYMEVLMPDSWRPQGSRIGWLDEAYLYLTPDATYSAIVQMAREQGEAFSLTQRTLWKRLDERGVLMREIGESRYTSRIQVHGKRERVVCVSRQILRTYGEKTGPTGPTGPRPYNLLKYNILDGKESGPVLKSHNSYWANWATVHETGGPVGPVTNDQNSNWATNGQKENEKNQIDIDKWPSWPSWPRNIYIPPKDFEKKAHISEQPISCPKCLARRIDTIGGYQFCLACGHKWQIGENHDA